MTISEDQLVNLGHDEEYADLTPITNAGNYIHHSRFVPWSASEIGTRGAEVPLHRSGHRMVFCEASGQIYLVGGYHREITNDHQIIEFIRQDTHVFHTDTLKWRNASATGTLPTQLASHCLLPIGRLLLVAGGTGVPFGAVNEQKLYFYSIYRNAWTVVEPRGELPMPCYGQTLNHVVVNGEDYVYTIGGTAGLFYTMAVHRIRLSDFKWELLPPGKSVNDAPFGRYRHETVLHNNRLWVFSGNRNQLPEHIGLRMIPVFHLEKCQWRYVSTFGDIPPFLICFAASHIDKYVVLTGGYFVSGYVNRSIYLFNLETREWNIIGTWNGACRFHSSAIIPHRHLLVIFGGMRYYDPQNPLSMPIRNNRTWVFPLHFLGPPSLLELSWRAVLNSLPALDHALAAKLVLSGVPRHLIERYLHVEPEAA